MKVPEPAPLSREPWATAYADARFFDADQDRRAEDPDAHRPPLASQRAMVAAAELAAHHPDTYARRKGSPTFPQPGHAGPSTDAAASSHLSAGVPSTPAGRRAVMTAASGGTPSTSATPAVQG